MPSTAPEEPTLDVEDRPLLGSALRLWSRTTRGLAHYEGEKAPGDGNSLNKVVNVSLPTCWMLVGWCKIACKLLANGFKWRH